MKKYIVLLLCLITVVPIYAQVFTALFADKTLRIDYIFNGNASEQSICLDGLSSLPAWAGRKHHLLFWIECHVLAGIHFQDEVL